MNDKLREHINQNRPSYEVHKGDYDAWWGDIDKALAKQGRTVTFWPTFLKVAASVVLILATVFVFLRFSSNTARYSQGFSLMDLSPELAEAEIYYGQLVNEKLEIIRTTQGEVDPVILEEMSLLDSAYVELKMDLKDNADNEEVVNAMIQNYRLKLMILEQILESIQEEENGEDDEEEETISI